MLVACQAVGAISAVKLAPPLVGRMGNGQALVSVVAAIGCSNLIIWLVRTAWAVGFALALGACATMTWNIVTVVLRQTLVPKELQGRVNSSYRLFAWGALPIGAGLAGVISKRHGTPAVYALGVGYMAVVAVHLTFGAESGSPTPEPSADRAQSARPSLTPFPQSYCVLSSVPTESEPPHEAAALLLARPPVGTRH